MHAVHAFLFAHFTADQRYLLGTAWNLLLCVIPVWLARRAERLDQQAPSPPGPGHYVALALLLCAWLAFVPNTCYLLTEWRHLYFRLVNEGWPQKAWRQPRYYADMAYWTFFFQAYSAAGLLAMTLAIRPIARVCARHGVKFLYLEPALFVMMSVAVYLGLVVRLNSWNVVTHPWIVALHVVVIPVHPVLSLTVVLFAGYLLGIYHLMDLLVEGVVGRWGKVDYSTRPDAGVLKS